MLLIKIRIDITIKMECKYNVKRKTEKTSLLKRSRNQ
jgi:hypothetical protein